MYILWEPYKDGYTVKDTKDGVIEYFSKPTLRRLFRKGIEIEGITCDEKNVIHFNAQHSASTLKKQASVNKAKLLLSGKIEISDARGKVIFNLNGSEGTYKIPYIGNYTYEIRVQGSDVDTQALYFDDVIKDLCISVHNMANVLVKLPKSTTRVLLNVPDSVKQFTLDCNQVSVTPSGEISEYCSTIITNYNVSSIYSEDTSFFAYANMSFEVPKGITNFVLDYLQFVPTVVRIPRHVKKFSSNSTYCRMLNMSRSRYTKAKDYLTRADFAYKYLTDNTMTTFHPYAEDYLEHEKHLIVYKKAPYMLVIEDPVVTRVDAYICGMVVVIPKGTRSYIGENIDCKYNIILEV